MTNPSSEQPGPAQTEVTASTQNRLYASLGETEPKLEAELILAKQLAEAVKAQGGQTYIMGGYARDEALRRAGQSVESQDLDVEIFGLAPEKVRNLLDQLDPGIAKPIGKSFEVMQFHGLEVSLPRRDIKTGPGHNGFSFELDPHMTLHKATSRRDFTIDSLALDPLTGDLIDEHGGLADLKNKVLRATDPNTFGDDPLRALRAMQLAGRFNLTVEPNTLDLCRQQNLSELSPSRIGQEWRKLLLLSPKPSVGLEVARQIGVIDQLHPELSALTGTLQDPDWHPEGDVWTHTLMAVDCAAEIARREKLDQNDSLVLLLATLLHDSGKPETTIVNNDTHQIESPKHDVAGIKPTERFLELLATPKAITSKVSRLVRNHMFLTNHPEPTDRAVRRLADRLQPATIQELVLVAEADSRGRDLPWHGFTQGKALIEQALRLQSLDSAPKPLVMGRHLVQWGEKPGPHFNLLLSRLYAAQLEGKISSVEEARDYLGQAS
jgi:tRNA nucleotidyltransferase (CCA-adding enzyme)